MADQDLTIKGVSLKHAPQIAKVAKEMNTFIFIRPSTDDTVRLIEAGFATKSNDVHDKSSDWGPMAGMVPVDQGLNKKANAPDPNWQPLLAKQRGHAHGISQCVHLKIGLSLTTKQPMIRSRNRRVVVRQTFVKGVGMVDRFYASESGAGKEVAVSFYRDKKHGRIFARRFSDGAIYWLHQKPDAVDGELIPIYVWAYHGTPITGDYDLWLVAPHISNRKKYGLDALLDIYTAVDEHKTPSAATPFILKMNAKLNQVCMGAFKDCQQVFNHGAEAQNYGFTQALDGDKLAMFTPTGGFRGIDPKMAHFVLDDMERRGYIVIRNKKWTMINPALGGMGTRSHGRLLWQYVLSRKPKRGSDGVSYTQSGDSKVVKAFQERQALKESDPKAWAGKTAMNDKDRGERRALGQFGQNLAKARMGATQLHGLRGLKAGDFPKSSEILEPADLLHLRRLADSAMRDMQNGGANMADVTLDISGMATDEDAFGKAFRNLAK